MGAGEGPASVRNVAPQLAVHQLIEFAAVDVDIIAENRSLGHDPAEEVVRRWHVAQRRPKRTSQSENGEDGRRPSRWSHRAGRFAMRCRDSGTVERLQ